MTIYLLNVKYVSSLKNLEKIVFKLPDKSNFQLSCLQKMNIMHLGTLKRENLGFSCHQIFDLSRLFALLGLACDSFLNEAGNSIDKFKSSFKYENSCFLLLSLYTLIPKQFNFNKE